ncbi:MAG: hypothetical protein Q9181_001863 [Wetmoreana brouardii]
MSSESKKMPEDNDSATHPSQPHSLSHRLATAAFIFSHFKEPRLADAQARMAEEFGQEVAQAYEEECQRHRGIKTAAPSNEDMKGVRRDTYSPSIRQQCNERQRASFRRPGEGPDTDQPKIGDVNNENTVGELEDTYKGYDSMYGGRCIRSLRYIR